MSCVTEFERLINSTNRGAYTCLLLTYDVDRSLLRTVIHLLPFSHQSYD